MRTRKMSTSRETRFFRTVRLELRRSVCSPRFLLGTVMMILWMVANVIHETPSYAVAVQSGAPYLFDMAVDGTLYMGPVLLVIATIPYSSCFLTEWECGFYRHVVERVGILSYGVSKACAAALSAFLMAIVSMGMFLAALCVLEIPQTIHYESVKGQYLELAASAGPWAYYSVRFAITGLVCSFSAVFALMITCWVPNIYACFLSPLIGYYLLICVLDRLALLNWSIFSLKLLSPMSLFFGQAYSGHVQFSFIWTVTLLLTMTALCSRKFVLGLERRMDT